jgi:hypothetical protein
MSALTDADRLTDQDSLVRFRQPFEVKAALVIAVLRETAKARRSACYMTAFYVDAGPIARRLMWDQSEALETFGIERDLLHAGVPAEGIQPLLKTMRANLGHLDELRAQVLAKSQAALIEPVSQAGAP